MMQYEEIIHRIQKQTMRIQQSLNFYKKSLAVTQYYNYKGEYLDTREEHTFEDKRNKINLLTSLNNNYYNNSLDNNYYLPNNNYYNNLRYNNYYLPGK